MIENILKEITDFEQTIQEMEKYTGIPYPWGSFKLAFLPYNFPYQGTDTPLLSMVTPFILTEDKRCLNYINHQIALSWTGNLVTNMNWDMLWLNKGFATFLERKVSKILQN